MQFSQLSETFLRFFETIEDPRVQDRNKRHEFESILVITILAVICGSNSWTEIAYFGRIKYKWLSSFIHLPNGIPSHDTFNRVFSKINVRQFESSFTDWIQSLDVDVVKKIIAIDGKTLRGSGNKRKKKSPLHLVSAWVSEENILLGHVATREKSNEITAIPELLEMINVKGSTVTVDAMGCQKSITRKIREKGAHFIVSLKDNQKSICDAVKTVFDKAEEYKFKKFLHLRKKETIKGHGRYEKRRYTLISARDQLAMQLQWPDLKGIGLLEVKRTQNGRTQYSKRYFLTSHSYNQIDAFMKGVRRHWGIEIGLHWSLDVSFLEDHNQTSARNAARNLATVRRVALSALRKQKSEGGSISCRRKMAGWSDEYLLKVLRMETN
tara:strand:- start:44 stop:1189 length:1146 start_codon:yes stop_codon:yes gene_type:complete